jgi:hypothetical protein
MQAANPTSQKIKGIVTAAFVSVQCSEDMQRRRFEVLS